METLLKHITVPNPPAKAIKSGRHKKGCVCGKCVQSGGTGGYHPTAFQNRGAKVSQPAPETQRISPDAAKPDSDLFGDIKSPEETAETSETSETFADMPKGDEKQPEEKNDNPEAHRTLATMIWDSVILMLCGLMGDWWLPRPFSKNPDPAKNEIPFDEREMVILAFCIYFASLGLAVLSPLQNLCGAIFGYCMPRLGNILTWFKFKFMKKAKPTPPPSNDTRMPENPAAPPKSEETPGREKSTDAPNGGNLQLEHLN